MVVSSIEISFEYEYKYEYGGDSVGRTHTQINHFISSISSHVFWIANILLTTNHALTILSYCVYMLLEKFVFILVILQHVQLDRIENESDASGTEASEIE